MEEGVGQHTRIITRRSGLKTLARSVSRMNRASISRQVMKDKVMKEKILGMVTNDIQKELAHLCAKKTNSILRKSTPQTVRTFSWEDITQEVRDKTPTMYHILKGCVEVKRRTRKLKPRCRKPANKGKKRSGQNKPSATAVIGLCAAILLRNKNIRMNLVQKLVGLILNCGHASKQVHACVIKVITINLNH